MAAELINQSFVSAGGADVPFAWLCLAYIGPGGGLTAIGAFFALVFAVLVAILGFIWYPIRRLLRNRKPPEDNREVSAE